MNNYKGGGGVTYAPTLTGRQTIRTFKMSEGQNVQDFRLGKLEDSIGEILSKLEEILEEKGQFRLDVMERITRLEERHGNLQRIVYGAGGALVTIQVASILYILQRLADTMLTGG